MLGTVGEPINPEAWNWYNDVVGKGRCPIVDTWWQTETGGHLITPLPGATRSSPARPRSALLRRAAGVARRASGEEIHETAAEGVLCMKDSWPGQMRTLWGDHERFVRRPISRTTRAITSPATAAAATRMATTGSPAASMT
jgi:acetyl-CoA synthetase